MNAAPELYAEKHTKISLEYNQFLWYDNRNKAWRCSLWSCRNPARCIWKRSSSFPKRTDLSARSTSARRWAFRAVHLLAEGGFINIDVDGGLTLTDAGREVAEKIYERHTVISQWLISLGVNEETAIEDACKIEHDISDESFAAIKRHIKKGA